MFLSPSRHSMEETSFRSDAETFTLQLWTPMVIFIPGEEVHHPTIRANVDTGIPISSSNRKE